MDIDQHISREETATIVANNVVASIEEWKNWVVGLLEYERFQWKERYQNIASIKELLEQDKKENVRKAKEAKEKKGGDLPVRTAF